MRSSIHSLIKEHKCKLLGVITFVLLYPVLLVLFFSLLKLSGVSKWIIFDVSKLGIFGDLFGSLNVIFSALAFLGIMLSVFLQNSELKLQRKELKLQKKELEENRNLIKKQNFEYYFFQELFRLREVRNSVFIRGGYKYSFKLSKQEFTLLEKQDCKGEHAFFILNKWCGDWFFKIKNDKNLKYSQYEQIYDKFLYTILGSYYRVLFNIIKNIDGSYQITDEEKIRYIHLIRAELSNSELFFLLHNGLSKYGKEKFKPLLEKYEMFEHFHDHKTSITLLIQYNEKAFGNSEKLKEKLNSHIKKVSDNPNRAK